MYLYHFITLSVSVLLTFWIGGVNGFGVEETLQCGLMTTLGLDDEILMLLPFLMVPLQLWLILKIIRTFFMRDSLKKFVIKYAVCMASLMSIECLKVILIIYGS